MMRNATGELWRASFVAIAISAVLVCAEFSKPHEQFTALATAESHSVVRAQSILTPSSANRPDADQPRQLENDVVANGISAKELPRKHRIVLASIQ